MKIRGQTVFPPMERIQRLSVCNLQTGCWEWTATTRNGYGRLVVGSRSRGTRKTVSAHRYAYESLVGIVPDGLCVLHKCDNRRCVNPIHLFVGTKEDNAKDMVAKGRWGGNPHRGCAHPKSKLTVEQVLELRQRYASGVPCSRLGRDFGIHPRTAWDVAHRVTYKNIPIPPKETP